MLSFRISCFRLVSILGGPSYLEVVAFLTAVCTKAIFVRYVHCIISFPSAPQKWSSVPQLHGRIKVNSFIADDPPLFSYSLWLREYMHCKWMTNIGCAVLAELSACCRSVRSAPSREMISSSVCLLRRRPGHQKRPKHTPQMFLPPEHGSGGVRACRHAFNMLASSNRFVISLI